jgi:hypothetical protein
MMHAEVTSLTSASFCFSAGKRQGDLSFPSVGGLLLSATAQGIELVNELTDGDLLAHRAEERRQHFELYYPP